MMTTMMINANGMFVMTMMMVMKIFFTLFSWLAKRAPCYSTGVAAHNLLLLVQC